MYEKKWFAYTKKTKTERSRKMTGKYRVRTDLALESREKFERNNVEVEGVEIHEDYQEELDLRTTVVQIRTDSGAKTMEKPKGVYITMEAPNMVIQDEAYHEKIAQVFSGHLRKILDLEEEKTILVVGLGNRDITPDALGPYVVQNLSITRHIVKEYGKMSIGKDKVHCVCSLVPGVMAQTGMETLEIIRGVVQETHPDAVIAIDALAARGMRRLNCTIQITDTGIMPGSGVLNFRNGLTKETIGVPVIGIGVPTVIDAATIVHDAVSKILESLEEAEMEEFLEDIISPKLHQMFVTPKDVDETIKIIGKTIAEGINLAVNAC